MAEKPVKDVFDDDEPDTEDQRVIDEAEETELQEGAKTAAEEAGTDDIEIVLAEEEQAGEEDEKGDETGEEGDPGEGVDQEADGEAVDESEKSEEEIDEELRKAGLSKEMRKRLSRERRIVRRTRDEAATVVAQERNLRIAAERKSLTAHKNLTEVLLVNIDNQIKAKNVELKQVLETGDTDKQVDVQGELDDLRAKKREMEGAKASIEQQSEEFERTIKEAPAAAPQVSPAAQEWLGRNKWFGKKGFVAESLLTKTIDNQLGTERSDKTSPEYFRELNRRIREQMPDLADKAKRAFKQPERSAVRSAVAPVSRSSAQAAEVRVSNKRRITLDKSDLQNMREHKLDPSNKEHVALYAREKLNAS